MDYERFLEDFHHNDVFSINNGIKILKMDEGYAEAELDYQVGHNNFMGTLHGGALATLADVTAGISIISFGKLCVTLNANINYIKPVQQGKIKAVANALHRSRQIGTSEVRIYNEDKDLLCSCSYLMFITKKDAVPRD